MPLALLPQLDPEVLAWTIPGWHEAKLRALLETLPKALRKALAPLDELASALAVGLRPFDGPMLPALERAIYERTGERVPRDAWDLRALPAYLQLSFRVVDDHDKTVGPGSRSGRSPAHARPSREGAVGPGAARAARTHGPEELGLSTPCRPR